MRTRHLLAALLSISFIACLPTDELALDGADDPFLTGGKADESIDAAGVLQVVNTASVDDLVEICRIHSLPAGNIVAHRTTHGPIADLGTLDAIANVGPLVLASLQRCWQDSFRDGGTGGWRGTFGLPIGDVALAVDLVMPAFQNDRWTNIDRAVEDVVVDTAVQLEPVIEHAQCLLRGTNPGRVVLECRRRKFRPSMMAELAAVPLDRRWFTVTAEITADGTFSGSRLHDDGRPGGERQLIWIAGRLEANRTVTVTGWKYVFITPYADESLQPRLIDLAWGADETVAQFRTGDWDRFDEMLGQTVPVAGGTARQACARIDGQFTSWVEGCRDGERITAVPAFEIDRTEVTEAAYAACVQEGRCNDPCPAYQSIENCAWSNGHRYFTTSTRPIVGVTHAQAAEFCAWAGKRLVTTDQWHLAAGAGAGAYPWGDTAPICARANLAGCGDALAAVGTRPQGRSPAGVDDLAGNVAEHVRDGVTLDVIVDGAWRGSTTSLELRGGSFTDDADGARAAKRTLLMPSMTEPMRQLGQVGIRCVRE